MDTLSATKICIVYSKRQKVRRRLIKCAHDAHFQHHKNLHPNEGWLEIPIKVYEGFKHTIESFSDEKLKAHIAGIIGPPENDRCVVVCPQGTVKHIVCADPTIDFHPDGQIILHEKARHDWKFNKGQWIEPARPEDPSPVETNPRINSDVFEPEKNLSSARFFAFNTDWNIQCRGDDLIIGCQTLPISQWEKFSDAEVGVLSDTPLQTAKWWKENGKDILAFAHGHQKKCGGGKPP